MNEDRQGDRMAVLDDAVSDLRQTVAALERKLDECTAEHDEALARETATAEVLQVINSSSGDLDPVFEAMLDKALRLCEAALGHITTFDGELFHHVATQGDPDLVAFLRQTRLSEHQPTRSP